MLAITRTLAEEITINTNRFGDNLCFCVFPSDSCRRARDTFFRAGVPEVRTCRQAWQRFVAGWQRCSGACWPRPCRSCGFRRRTWGLTAVGGPAWPRAMPTSVGPPEHWARRPLFTRRGAWRDAWPLAAQLRFGGPVGQLRVRGPVRPHGGRPHCATRARSTRCRTQAGYELVAAGLPAALFCARPRGPTGQLGVLAFLTMPHGGRSAVESLAFGLCASSLTRGGNAPSKLSSFHGILHGFMLLCVRRFCRGIFSSASGCRRSVRLSTRPPSSGNGPSFACVA